MPSVAATVTATTTTQVKIAPALKKKLLTRLKIYQDLRQQKKVLEAAMDKLKGEVGSIREDIGEMTVAVEGFKVTCVAGVSTTLDKKKLIEQGVTMAQIENATVVKPKKPYEKISCPGEHDGEE